MSKTLETEELVFLKEGRVDDKVFFIFQNMAGELRAVEAEKVTLPAVSPGDKLKALVKKKGCAGRQIEQLYQA